MMTAREMHRSMLAECGSCTVHRDSRQCEECCSKQLSNWADDLIDAVAEIAGDGEATGLQIDLALGRLKEEVAR